MTDFHFIRPLWLFLFIPFALLIYLRLQRKMKLTQIEMHFPEHLRQALMVGEQGWAKHAPIVLLGVLGLLATMVAAGPTWQRQTSPMGEDIAPLVVVLDVSSSMQQSDIAPSRLYRAKQKIYQLIDERDSGTTALIVYAGSAHLAMPLTRDKAIFKPLLDTIEPSVMPREGKFEQYSLAVIEQTLASESSKGSILLVTDAVSAGSIAPWKAYLQQSQQKLVIFGIGDPEGNAAMPMEKKSLEELADKTNGELVIFSQDDSDIEQLSRLISSQVTQNGDESEPWLDAGYGLIWLIIPVYLLWARRGWIVQWCVIMMVSSATLYSPTTTASDFAFIDLWMTKDQQGQRLYQQQDYEQAAKTFDDPQWKAFSYYQAGEYELSQEYFLRSDTLTAQLGVGAVLAHQKEYVAARRWYKNILKDHPDCETAVSNLALMENIISQIDQFSESQTNNTERQNSKELGDKPQTSEGAEQQIDQNQIIQETLSAEQILNNAALNEQWMKRVESNLAPFLVNKFYLQLEKGLGTQLYTNNKEIDLNKTKIKTIKSDTDNQLEKGGSL